MSGLTHATMAQNLCFITMMINKYTIKNLKVEMIMCIEKIVEQSQLGYLQK